MIRKQDIPYELVLNYDQTWIQGYRVPKKTMKVKRTKRSKCNQVRVAHVVGSRKGLSLCTSSWCNGDPGPLFVSLSSSSVSDAYVEEMNRCHVQVEILQKTGV